MNECSDNVCKLIILFRKLDELIGEASNSIELSASDIISVKRDREFVNYAINTLASNNTEYINELWIKVQSSSHYFGGDYLRYYNTSKFNSIIENIFNEMLATVVQLRNK